MARLAGGGLAALSRLLLETALDLSGLLGALGRSLRSRPSLLTHWALRLCHVGTPRSLPVGDERARAGREATGPARRVYKPTRRPAVAAPVPRIAVAGPVRRRCGRSSRG